MNAARSFAALVFVLLSPASRALAISPTPAETAEARRWAAAKLEQVVEPPRLAEGLNVLASYGPVTQNAHADLPLVLGGKVYGRGFYCHANSSIVVRLPGPGRAFAALLGVNSNHMTQPGRGTIVCSVAVAGRTVFKSHVLREGMPPAPVNVDLAGADEFAIEVGDAGDGIACDQSAWVDARATLSDGKTVWLGDLPLRDARRKPPTTDPPLSFTYGGRPSAELLKALAMSSRKGARAGGEKGATWVQE